MPCERRACGVKFVHVHCKCGGISSTSPCLLCVWRGWPREWSGPKPAWLIKAALSEDF